jgi:2-polyprenyl-3-methyl-5-hydroxy-6-metoxy-1,4-benzoquinol methylase
MPGDKTTSPPSPELFLDGVGAFHTTAALKAAIALDLFSHVAAGVDKPDSLAQATGAAPRGLRILCDFLTVAGYLEKSAERYALTPSSGVFLDRRSPAYLGSIIEFLASPEMLEMFFHDPAAFVRKGGAGGSGTVGPDDPVWVKFARAMAPFIAPVAQATGAILSADGPPLRRVLDIAAGHGLFGLEIALRQPQARVTAVDWKNVLDVAAENYRAKAIADRLERKPGSAFDVDFGTGYDLALLTNFLHHFDEATCISLLRKVHAALRPGGRAAATEFVPDEGRVSPPIPASFAFIMLATTPAGDAYTYRELDRMFRAAGFAGTQAHKLLPSPQTLMVAAKPG